MREQFQIEHASAFSREAVLIKLADKTANVLDVTHRPPTNWNIDRRREYLDWAKAVVSNCPRVNGALENYFAEVLEQGRRKLLSC